MKRVILFIESSRGFGRDLQRGVAKFAAVHGPWTFYRMPAMYLDPSGYKIKKEIHRMKEWGADGIIMRDMKGAEELLSMKLPTVISAYRDTHIRPDVAKIFVDDIGIGRIAAEYLLNLGFKNFAFCGFDEHFWSRKRCEGFSGRISEAGFKVHLYKRPKSGRQLLWDEEQNIMCKWLKSLPLPIGLMACIDERAQDIVEACKIIQRHIPEEIAVISCDNDELICELSNPQISSIALNAFETGYEAARLLDQLMDGKEVSGPPLTIIPTHVVARKSTEIIAIEDLTVANAIRFIRDHVREKIQVNEVANAVTTSRRVLERKFKESIGRSIYKEIERVRVDQIKNMLIETNISISDIAKRFNFENIHYFSYFFRKETNINPLAFRKRAQLKPK